MKKARDDKPVYTIPEGAYEGGTMNKEIHSNKNNKPNDRTTDHSGNGYPLKEK